MISQGPLKNAAKGFVRYLGDLYTNSGGKLLWALALALVSSVLTGMSLIMLIPLLALLGMQSEGELTGLPLAIKTGFDTFHIPLTLGNVLIIFVIMMSARSLLTLYSNLLSADIRLSFTNHVRERLYRSIAFAQWSHLSKSRHADIVNTLSYDIGRIEAGVNYLLGFIISGIMLAVYVYLAFELSWKLSLLALLLAGLLLLILMPQIKKSRGLGEELTSNSRNVQREISDFLAGIKLAKSFSGEEHYIQRYTKVIYRLQGRLLEYALSNGLASAAYQVASAVALCALFYVGSEILAIDSAELLVLLVVISRLLPLFSGIHSNVQQVLLMLPSYEAAMAMQEGHERNREPLADTPPTIRLQQAINLEKVCFSYESAGVSVLKDVSFTIPARQTTALIGDSGAGKSTLADLLSGLLVPSAGELKLDGRPLDESELFWWRKQVSYISQDTFLFHDSIRNNLRWLPNEHNENEAQLWAALELAAADRFVRELPEGLDTVIGERGTRLSGGERQRIALARALLWRPQLIILDEATSALDDKNETYIHESIDRLHGQLTIVFITHRKTTLRFADQVLKLEGGRMLKMSKSDVQQDQEDTIKEMR